MTQKESVLQLLNQAEWVCGREFLANYLQEYRTRINEIRKDGFTIEARRCTQHQHRAGMQEWSLVQKPRQTPEMPPRNDFPARPIQSSQPNPNNSYYPKNYCCDVNDFKPGSHSRKCETQTQAA